MSCCCPVAKSWPTLFDPRGCSTPGFPVLHSLLEFAQIQLPWVSDAIEPSHPLLPPSPTALNLSQHQGLPRLFTLGDQSIGASASASVLPVNIQDRSPLRLTGLISLLSRGLSSFLQHHNEINIWVNRLWGKQIALYSSDPQPFQHQGSVS